MAARLRDLEAADVVGKRTLPPPAASTVYELTEFGRGLARPVGALAAWGTDLLGAPQPSEAFRASWLVLPLRAIRPELAQHVDLCCQYRVEGDTATLRITAGRIDIVGGQALEHDVVITTDPETLVHIGNRTLPVATAFADGRLQVEGERDAIETLTHVLGLAD